MVAGNWLGASPSWKSQAIFNMKLLKIRHRCFEYFVAEFKCEYCGSVETISRERKYYVLKEFLPYLQCRKCGKQTGEN